MFCLFIFMIHYTGRSCDVEPASLWYLRFNNDYL